MPLGGQDITTAMIQPDNWTDWAAEGITYSNITLGNGTETAAYSHVSGLVICRYQLTWGSTTSFSSTPGILLPVTAAGSYAQNVGIGVGHVLDTSAGSTSREGIVVVYNASSYVFFVRTTATAGTVSSTVPFTWATGDILSFTAVYEAA